MCAKMRSKRRAKTARENVCKNALETVRDRHGKSKSKKVKSNSKSNNWLLSTSVKVTKNSNYFLLKSKVTFRYFYYYFLSAKSNDLNGGN